MFEGSVTIKKTFDAGNRNDYLTMSLLTSNTFEKVVLNRAHQEYCCKNKIILFRFELYES